MRLLIIGAGAVGMFVGARLAHAGHSVCLVGRPSLLNAVRNSGLMLIEPNAPPRLTSPQCVTALAAAFADAATYDLALLTVKAYDTDAVIHELHAAGATVPPILTLQNGVGNEEALADAFGAGRVLSAAMRYAGLDPSTRTGAGAQGALWDRVGNPGRSCHARRDRRALTGAGFYGAPIRRLSRPQVDEAADEHPGERTERDSRMDPRTGDARPNRCGTGSPRLAGSGRRNAPFGHRARVVGSVSIPAHHATSRATALGLGRPRIAPVRVRGAGHEAALAPIGAGGGPVFRGALAEWSRGAHWRDSWRSDPRSTPLEDFSKD